MEKDDYLKILLNMMRIRKLEELCAELYTQEKIRGFLHLYIGEEAVASGVLSLLGPGDNVMATYREHGHALLKGLSARSIMAEMFGKVEGCCRGRGGSMHLISLDKRFYGGNAIVAAGIPQAVGLALASKKLNENRLTVCFFGEGAVAEGVFHESLNMASLWSVPLLLCCENNQFAMGTALSRSQAQIDMCQKARAHNVTSQVVDGMNVFDVVEKTKLALDFIKTMRRPYFLEFKTYRFRPHSMFDPELYRSKEEILKWKERDPINFLRQELFSKNLINAEVHKSMEDEVAAEMLDAIHFAENGQSESSKDLIRFVYENDLP